MSKIQWEYDLVEKPFCEQLRLMGWQWLKGDTDVFKLTERDIFRAVLLKGRLIAARSATQEMVERIRQEVRKVGF